MAAMRIIVAMNHPVAMGLIVAMDIMVAMSPVVAMNIMVEMGPMGAMNIMVTRPDIFAGRLRPLVRCGKNLTLSALAKIVAKWIFD